MTKRIAVVADDHDDNRQTIACLLEMLGYEVRTGCDGVEAVELADRSQPQLVILDIGMPRMDGLEAARAIRARSGELPCIVALSGYAHMWEEALNAGFDLFFTKPLDLQELLSRMREACPAALPERC